MSSLQNHPNYHTLYPNTLKLNISYTKPNTFNISRAHSLATTKPARHTKYTPTSNPARQQIQKYNQTIKNHFPGYKNPSLHKKKQQETVLASEAHWKCIHALHFYSDEYESEYREEEEWSYKHDLVVVISMFIYVVAYV